MTGFTLFLALASAFSAGACLGIAVMTVGAISVMSNEFEKRAERMDRQEPSTEEK